MERQFFSYYPAIIFNLFVLLQREILFLRFLANMQHRKSFPPIVRPLSNSLGDNENLLITEESNYGSLFIKKQGSSHYVTAYVQHRIIGARAPGDEVSACVQLQFPRASFNLLNLVFLLFLLTEVF